MRELTELISRVAEMERRMSGMFKHGTVHEVNGSNQTLRLNLGPGAGGSPFLSPWVPYGQIAGALKVHSPPSVGQQMTLLSPTGDLQQAVAMPMHWSQNNPSPSTSLAENVLTFGNVRITVRGDLVEVRAPNFKVVASQNVDIEAKDATVKAESVLIEADKIDLGAEGGPPVARIGDSTSDGAVITSGSSKVSAA